MSDLITLKFSPDMTERILNGYKCCTTRDEQKGNVGDLFTVAGQMYRICRIGSHYFMNVTYLYEAEGFSSEEAFEKTLLEFYPDLKPDSRVWTHWFAYVGDGCPQFRVKGAACSDPARFCSIYELCRGED